MFNNQENSLAAQENAQRPPTNDKASLTASNAAPTVDESEFEERHGGQYHLRHHLSGCSQTLYVLDFEKDFSSSERVAAPDNVMPLPDTVNAAYAEMDAVTLASHVAYSEAPTVVEAVPSPSEAMNAQNIEQGVELLATSGEKSVELDVRISEAQAENEQIPLAGDAAEVLVTDTTLGLNSPLVADFNDQSLGGWELEGELATEQVLENGQLHFSGGMLNAGAPILSRDVAFSAGEPYQFEMRVSSSEGETAPRFDLIVNGETIAMEATRQGNDFILRAEFVATTSDSVNVAIMPVSPMASDSSVWLDDLVLQPAPVTPPQFDFGLQLEPIFDFAAIGVQLGQSEVDLVQPELNLSQMLSQTEVTLFADHSPLHHEAYYELSMSSLTAYEDGESSIAHAPELPSFFVFDPQPLELVPEPVHI